MKKIISIIAGFCCVCFAQASLSPTAVVCHGDDVIVAEHDASKLDIFSPAEGKVKKSIELKDHPNGLVIKDDKAYVTIGGVLGKVCIIDLKDGKTIAEIPVGHTPMSPVIRGNNLYICNRFDNNVAVIDLATNKIVKTLEASREPVGVAVSEDGKQLWIANLLPAGPSDGDYVGCNLTYYNGDKAEQIKLSNGTQSVRGITMSPDGKHIVLSHVLSRFQLPTTQVDKGWMNTNAITIIDTSKPTEYRTVLLDESERGAANPWAVAFTPDSQTLIVSQSGTHDISIIDFPALLKKMEGKDTTNELGFMAETRLRVPLPTNGLRSLATDGKKVYGAGYFSDNLVSATLTKHPEIAAWELVPGGSKISQRKRGEMYYNDASFCFQNWQSCVTCHPDTRVDGLNWDLMNDGMGNPKNTRSMLISHRTSPVMTLGIRKDAETAVNAGFHHIQFVDVEPAVLEDVNEYLRNMMPVSSPALRRDKFLDVKLRDDSCVQCHAPELQRGELSDAAKRGKKIFKAAGCVECHPHPYFTTKALYDMGTLKGLDEGKKLVTPTLLEVWRTAPYMHDGRTNSLKEVITIHNHGDKRGKTKNLSDSELNDLVEYVRSL